MTSFFLSYGLIIIFCFSSEDAIKILLEDYKETIIFIKLFKKIKCFHHDPLGIFVIIVLISFALKFGHLRSKIKLFYEEKIREGLEDKGRI